MGSLLDLLAGNIVGEASLTLRAKTKAKAT